MADGPALALQAAVVSRLKANAGIVALVGTRVYDEPPQGAVFPYLRVGTMIARPLRLSGDCRHDDVTFSIEAHSRPVAGRVEAERIAFAVERALDGAALSMTGYSLHWCQYMTHATTRAADGRSYIANIAFEAALAAV